MQTYMCHTERMSSLGTQTPGKEHTRLKLSITVTEQIKQTALTSCWKTLHYYKLLD